MLPIRFQCFYQCEQCSQFDRMRMTTNEIFFAPLNSVLVTNVFSLSRFRCDVKKLWCLNRYFETEIILRCFFMIFLGSISLDFFNYQISHILLLKHLILRKKFSINFLQNFLHFDGTIQKSSIIRKKMNV